MVRLDLPANPDALLRVTLLKTRYNLDPDRVPFDFYEVVAALAPRVFFSISPLHDSNFDVRGVKKAIPKAREIYKLLGQADALQLRTPDCAHDFPVEVRDEAYRFIDQALGQAEAIPLTSGQCRGILL